MIRARLRRHRDRNPPAAADDDYVDIDPDELTGIVNVPAWLRDLGLMAWMLVGVALLLVGAVWLLGLTEVIVGPVIAAAVIAAVASPLIHWLNRHHVPRGLGAALLMLAIIAVGVGVMVVVVVGISGQSDSVTGHLDSAKETITGWLNDIGLDPSKAQESVSEASSSTSAGVGALLDGLATTVSKLSSLAFFLALTVLSLFFLLKDGPTIRSWAEGHLGVPRPLARTITMRVLQSLRGYFLGVTIVAGFNAAVVALGCLLIGVPLIGTIAAVTFLAAYVPYLGAWTAGGFTVLIALGNGGADAAGQMIVVELLANGILQQLVQPLAMGAALGIHPLAVLVVTIAGGALFGAIGLILAAPLVAATVRISADLSRARTAAERGPPDPLAAAVGA